MTHIYILDYVYLRHVPVMKVHLFTFIQICGLAVLWIIKSIKPVSIIFPLMVAAIVGVRMVSIISDLKGRVAMVMRTLINV